MIRASLQSATPKAHKAPKTPPPVSAAVQPIRVQRKSACTCRGGCSSCAPKSDIFEREADAAADQVMRKAAPTPLSEADEKPMMMEEPEGEAIPEPLLPALSGGHPLPPDLNQFFGTGFGHDFSAVRLHRDISAQRSAKNFGARAYTYGRHIAFATGEYAPTSSAGRHLIAHELAHVIQQGAAPLHGNAPRLTPTGYHIQRLCGPSEIHDVSGCVGAGGDIFGEPYLFNVNCDTFKPGEEARLEADARSMLLGTVASVNVHGFASEDGDETFNRDLSCLRATKLAQKLIDIGVTVTGLLAHGPTPGEPEPRRSAVIDPRSPVPESEPTPEPERDPELDSQPPGCGSFEQFVANFLDANPNMIADFAECICEGIKLADVLESLVQLVADPLFPDIVSSIIEKLDCLCNFWDWLQLIYDSGTEGGCWEFDNISLSDGLRIGSFFATTLVDCFSQNLGELAVETLTNLFVGGSTAGGGAAGSPGGPAGAGGGAAFSAMVSLAIKEMIDQKGAEIIDFLADLALYLAQNEITHGTPFPLDGCRSCMRLPSYFGRSDLSPLCDDWNEDLVPEGLRVPEWHGTPPSDGETP